MKAPLVVFDVGSTLIHPNFSNLRDWLDRKSAAGTPVATVEYAFRRAIAGDTFSGESEAVGQAHLFFTLCGCHEEDASAWEAWWEEIVQSGGAGSWLYASLDSEALLTLQLLRSSGCRLAAASNSNGTLRLELSQFGLLELFEDVFDSADLGTEKPAPEFYRAVLNALPPADRNVHVGDDLIKDMIGPVVAGFQQAVLYDPARIYRGLPRGATISSLSALARTLRIAP